MPKTVPTILEGSSQPVPCGNACEALAFLQQIYQTAPIMMVVVDHDFKIIRLNQQMANFIGRHLDKCPGIDLRKAIAKLSDNLTELLNCIFLTTEPITEKEFSFSDSSGKHVWRINAYPVTLKTTSSKAVSLIINDLSELSKTRDDLESALRNIAELQERLKLENQQLHNEINRDYGASHIVGESSALLQVMHQIAKVAPTDATVLITGDTGTGKELAAREIHRLSKRAMQPIVIVNCAALPANLIESELFGHEKGAFTGAVSRKTGRFEVADGGTIFLDEIGEMPLELQSKLLRVLQENQLERIGSNKQINIDVRIIAATNRDLRQEVEQGRFREDLFFRLHVFPIHLPALSERGTDILAIAKDFMAVCARRQGKNIKTISESSCRSLMAYNWPGNIRELRNVIERAVILCQADVLEVEFPGHTAIKPHPKTAVHSQELQSLHTVEKAHILRILNATSWRIRGNKGAAEILELKPTTLESRMLKLGIRRNTLR